MALQHSARVILPLKNLHVVAPSRRHLPSWHAAKGWPSRPTPQCSGTRSAWTQGDNIRSRIFRLEIAKFCCVVSYSGQLFREFLVQECAVYHLMHTTFRPNLDRGNFWLILCVAPSCTQMASKSIPTSRLHGSIFRKIQTRLLVYIRFTPLISMFSACLLLKSIMINNPYGIAAVRSSII